MRPVSPSSRRWVSAARSLMAAYPFDTPSRRTQRGGWRQAGAASHGAGELEDGGYPRPRLIAIRVQRRGRSLA